MRFNVTYDLVSPDSFMAGDVENSGFIGRDMSLREALKAFWATRTSQVSGVEAVEPNSSDHESARWITVYNGCEFLTGWDESRSLHFPDGMTGASRKRLCRFIQNSGTA